MRQKRTLYVLVIATLLIAGCATVAPGEDQRVVRAEQVLQASLPVYDSAMEWYFSNVASLNPQARAVMESIRKGFPPAYRSLDQAVTLYKANKTGDFAGQQAALEALVTQITGAVFQFGGPNLAGGK